MRIGMVGARFAGLDGVSLESTKLAEALRGGGHDIAWFAGEIGPGLRPSTPCPVASFDSKANIGIQRSVFGGGDMAGVHDEITEVAKQIRHALESFLDEHRVDAIVVENTWAIPMQFPLAVAVAETVRDRSLPTVGHHHDFSWERERFLDCAAPDLLHRYFPPAIENVAHVVINSSAQAELLARRGLGSLLLPNVMDFESGAPVGDDGASFRRVAGLEPVDTVLLQPTRVIRRKGIELTLELAGAMSSNPKVVITHSDDLDPDYWSELTDLALDLRVDLRLVDVGGDLGSLTSAYEAADLVCLPSLYEGYGNALVEAVFHRKPVLVNRYSVYSKDIAPLGFKFIEIDGEITPATVRRANAVVSDTQVLTTIAEDNFAIGRSELSYAKALGVIEEGIAAATAR